MYIRYYNHFSSRIIIITTTTLIGFGEFLKDKDSPTFHISSLNILYIYIYDLMKWIRIIELVTTHKIKFKKIHYF